MNLWGRRLVLFGLVLATGLVVAHVIMIRRGGTSHALVQASTGSVAAPASQAKQGWAGANSASAGVTEAVVTPPTAIAPPVLANPQKGAPTVLSAAARQDRLARRGRSPAAAALIATTTRTFHDKNYKVSFDYPAMWTFTEKDHEISTFRLDAKRAEKNTTMRAVTAIPENPFPASTFTGAYVYLSVTPHSNDAKCAVAAAPEAAGRAARAKLSWASVSFMHGHDEQKSICTVEPR